MTRHPHPILILELERADGETLSGRVSAKHGHAVTFTGWLGLAGAIETALRTAGSAGEEAAHNGGHSDE